MGRELRSDQHWYGHKAELQDFTFFITFAHSCTFLLERTVLLSFFVVVWIHSTKSVCVLMHLKHVHIVSRRNNIWRNKFLHIFTCLNSHFIQQYCYIIVMSLPYYAFHNFHIISYHTSNHTCHSILSLICIFHYFLSPTMMFQDFPWYQHHQ